MAFPHTPDRRYFEDYIPGAIHEFGPVSVTEEEVIEFGKRYVPPRITPTEKPPRRASTDA